MIKLIISIIAFVLISFTDSTKTGTASYYSNKFEGRRTATGEIFKQKKYTAASNFFKLGSIVKVTNLINGKSVVVKINDRMHPKMARRGRIVDLTTTAANRIGKSNGLIKVNVELL